MSRSKNPLMRENYTLEGVQHVRLRQELIIRRGHEAVHISSSSFDVQNIPANLSLDEPLSLGVSLPNQWIRTN